MSNITFARSSLSFASSFDPFSLRNKAFSKQKKKERKRNTAPQSLHKTHEISVRSDHQTVSFQGIARESRPRTWTSANYA